jgi:hypothetical protein
MSNLKTDHEIQIDRIHDRQLAEKDAEIERLKLALHEEKQYAADLITTLRCEAEDKDSEIERLKTEQIKMFKAYDALEHSYLSVDGSGKTFDAVELSKAWEEFKYQLQRVRETK